MNVFSQEESQYERNKKYINGRKYVYTVDEYEQMQGKEEVFAANGQLTCSIEFRDGVPHGPYVMYGTNGKVVESGTYRRGRLHGTQKTYWENGQLHTKCTYKNGKKDGIYEEYGWGGIFIQRTFFRDDVGHSEHEVLDYAQKSNLIGKILGSVLKNLSTVPLPPTKRRIVRKALMNTYREFTTQNTR